MKRILRIIGLFFFIYNPPIAGFNLIHILAILAIVYVISTPYSRRLLVNVYKKSRELLLAYILCASVCLLNGKVHTLLNFFVIFVEIVPIAVATVSIYKQRCESLLNDIVLAGCLQAVISMIAFMSPPLQRLIIARMVSVGYSDVFDTMAGWRMFGLSRELTFAMPITQSIIACICLYLAIIKAKKYLIPIPILVFSSFINARTGMVVFVMGTIVVLFSVYRFDRSSIFNSVFALVAISVFLSLTPSLLSRNELTTDWLISGFDDISSFIRGEELNERDSYFVYATSANRYILPDSLEQLLFGTGERLQGTNSRYATDVGFINDIWTGGLVYLFLLWNFFLSKTFKIVACDAQFRKVRRANLLAYGIVAILIIINVKGQVFTWNEFVIFWFILFTIHISQGRIA